MHDVEDEVRELLQERAGDVGFDPQLPPRVTRGSRRRRALTVAAAGLGAAALVLVAVVGLRAFSVFDSGTPATSPEPTPTAGVETWLGIWEYTTREAAEAAQAQVDAGHMPWQTDARAFLEAYATRSDGLGWERVYFDESLDSPDTGGSGPLTIHLGDCPAVRDRTCPHQADVTIERLLRRDRTGIWSVTALLESPQATPAGEVPPTFVGVADGAVVVASTETGQILSTIAGPDVVGDRVGGADFFTTTVALSPDRRGVYFTAFESQGAGRRLMLAPLDGAAPQDLGLGWGPLPSPDGGRLAYVACAHDGCGGAIVVRDLRTGTETRVAIDPLDADVLGVPAAWLPDGRLAVNLVYPGDSPGSIRVIDPDSPPTAAIDAPEVEPVVPDVSSWRAVGYHGPTDGLLAVEACCGLQGGTMRVVSVDPDTGRELGTIVRGGWWVVEPDASGRDLLLIDDQGSVHVARDGEATRHVADGFADVDW